MDTKLTLAQKFAFAGLLLASMVLMTLFGAAGRARAAGTLYAAPVAAGSGDCSSWSNACTLQTALTGATSGDEIWVKAGVHKPGAARTNTFTLKSGVAVYGGFAGTESQLSDRNFANNATILSRY